VTALHRLVRAAAFASVLVAGAPAATGHERASYATHISVWGSHMAIQTTFGLLVGRWTDPSSGSWHWICPQAMGTLDIEDPPTSYIADDVLVMPGFDGLTVGTDDACSWSPAADALTNIQVFDAAGAPGEDGTAFAVTSSGQKANAVYRTTDAAETWSATSDPLSGADRFDTILVAPSDPRRVYVGASQLTPASSEPDEGVLFRSDDAGGTWTATRLPMEPAERDFKLMAVDPTDPDHFLARFGSAFADRIVQTFDGGESFTDLTRFATAEAIAWAPDGQTVVISGSVDTGVYRSGDGGENFEQISEINMGCLRYIDGVLWGCGGVELETAISRSFDDGETWEAIIEFAADVPVEVPCGPETTVGQVCPSHVNELREDFGLPIGDESDAGGPDAGTADTDSGRSDAGAADGSPDAGDAPGAAGSDCQVGARAPVEIALLLGVAAVALARRRRRRVEVPTCPSRVPGSRPSRPR